MNNQNTLIVIIGATGIGKTALSIALAENYGCDIISCDSRQFFKEMKIGTAVPSDEEIMKVNHHFIQNKSIFESYTVGDFEKETILKLDELFLINPIQILVGGSGLYVDAIINGMDSFPAIDKNIRAQVCSYYEQFGISFLQDKLKELDFKHYNFLSNSNPQTLQNPQRMMRFLEVCISSSLPYSSFLNQHKSERNFNSIVIGLEADRSIIYSRIDARVDQMVKNGLVKEATLLYEYKNLNALQTVGYREIFNYLDNEYSLEFAIDEIKKNTRRFSKRQITWFKRTANVIWFNYLIKPVEIVDKINNEIKKSVRIN